MWRKLGLWIVRLLLRPLEWAHRKLEQRAIEAEGE